MNVAQGRKSGACFPELQSRQVATQIRGPKQSSCWCRYGAPHLFPNFCEVSLPTLLAPGNLPALAKALPCKLVFLTSSD